MLIKHTEAQKSVGSRGIVSDIKITCLDERLASCAHVSLESQTWDHFGFHLVLQRIDPGISLTRYLVRFAGASAFRMLDEGWRVNDLPGVFEPGKPWPALASVDPSPWASQLREQEPIAAGMYDFLRHYLVCTMNECFDVLIYGEATPTVEEIAWHKL
jgi:hypothetical protein